MKINVTYESDSSEPQPTLRQVEDAVILQRLERCGGKKPETAQSLGISLKTLYNRLERIHATPS